MKKRLFLISVILLLSLTACTSQEKETDDYDTNDRFSRKESTETFSEDKNEVKEEQENYEDITAELKSAPETFHSEYEAIAENMANKLINSKILTANIPFDLNDIPDDEERHLQYDIIFDMFPLKDIISNFPERVSFPSGTGYHRKDYENIMHSFYQHDSDPAPDGQLLIEDGENICIIGSDGGSWLFLHSYSYKENENYILISGPCYLGSNGGEENMYQYNADILYKKTDKSMFGIQMIYANAYTYNINICEAYASSQLPVQNKKPYGPEYLYDKNLETAWVEGVDGVGIGETITLHLDHPQPVQDIIMYNGYMKSDELYQKNGRPTEVSVDFGGGNIVNASCYADASLPYAICAPSRISLERPYITDTITITVTDVAEGTHYDDTCISEIEVH